MATATENVLRAEERLNAVVHAYLQAVDSGAPPDREALARAHPDLSAELQAFFAGEDEAAGLARALRPAPPPLPQETDEPRLTQGPDETTEGPTWQPGQQLGDYELLEEVAEGGMGVVYKARQISLNRVVAVKMIRAGQLASGAEVERFQREAEAVAQLDHPNIVPLYEVGAQAGQHFFTMKWMEGGCLAQTVVSGQWSVVSKEGQRRAAQLLETVARAVHYAHQRGILHRDLKPANILLDGHGAPHVTDFGLAKRIDGDRNLTQSGAIVGTPSYMSPEQAAGETRRLTTATDTYALGAILYELLTGRPPFVAGSPLDLLILVRTQEPTPPSRLQPKLPRDLETICLKCLEKEPAKRYATAAALADDLHRYVTGEPILARAAGWWERGCKWAKRRPAVAALLLLVLAVTALGIGGVVREWRKTERVLEQREQALYVNQILLAGRYLAGSQPDRAGPVLDACPPGLRHWEWHYLMRQARPEVLRLRGHTDRVTRVAFRPDGQWLASADLEGWVKLWDAGTGQSLRTWNAHPPGVLALVFSADGRRLVTAGEDEVVKVWDATTGRELRAIPDAGTQVAISPDGQRLASGGRQSRVSLWDAATGKLLQRPQRFDSDVFQIAFSPDGRRVGAGSYGKLMVWDVEPGKEDANPKDAHRVALGTYVPAFSPDFRTIAVDNKNTRSISLYEAATYQLLGDLHDRGVGDDQLQISCPYNSLAFSADSQRLAVNYLSGSVVVFQLQTGTTVHHSARRATGAALAFSPDGRRLAFGAGAGNVVEVETWERKDERKPRTWGNRLENHDHLFALSPAGGRLAVVRHLRDAELAVWDLSEDRVGPSFPLAANCQRPALSADGLRVACASASGHEVRVWNARTGREVQVLRWPAGGNLRVALGPGGRYLAAADDAQTVAVWDVATGRDLPPLLAGRPIQGLAFGKDDRLAVGCVDTIEIWDVPAGKRIRTLSNGEGGGRTLCFDPNGRWLAANDGNRAVRVWEVTTGREVRTLHGYAGMAAALTFSRDGRRLVTGGMDGAVKLWDVASGHEVLTLPGHAVQVTFVGFTPDGRSLISGGADGVAKVWDGRLLEAEE
jgi:WD40 repeat protein/tRNA A-37 threonylcarbamoyl transferase component Bud32